MLIPSLFELLTKKPLYSYQLALLRNKSNKLIINKSRQTGISSFYAFYSLMLALQGKTILIISPSERQSLNFYDYVKKYLIKLIDYLKNPEGLISVEQSGFLKFKNGGSMRSLPNNPGTIRGYNADYIVIDEMAHIENAAELWAAVLPMISRGGKIILISTPYGEGNLYADIWKDAKSHGFEKINIHYKDCPDFTPEKIAELRQSVDTLTWRQEYENEFLASRESYFNMELLKACVDTSLTCSEFPEQISEKLILGIDIGRKNDKTAIIGMDAEGKIRLIRTIENKTFNEQKQIIAEYFKIASKINIDASGIGMQLGEELQNMNSGIINPIQITNEIKLNGFINLRKMIEEKKLTMPNNYELLRGLNLIERKQSGTNITFDAARTDETGHSDLAMALMLAVYHQESVQVKFINPELVGFL